MTDMIEAVADGAADMEPVRFPLAESAWSLLNMSDALIRAEFAAARRSARSKELEMEPATGIEPATL
jgi:hypothetical protein